MAAAGPAPRFAARQWVGRGRYWRKVLPKVLLLLTCGAFVAAAAAESAFPNGAAAYLIEVDGKPLWSRDADQPLPPASLTKTMTVLLVLESGIPLDSIATVSRRAAAATGTRLRLKPGERMQVRDLVTAALLDSANDACMALAERMAGSEAAFVSTMNRRAAQLGLIHTHFTNACGHDDPMHRSSARDLAEIAKLALRQPAFAETVGLVRGRIQTLEGRSWDLANTNELVGRYPGAVGVKTGYTPNAGKCLIALVQREGITVMLVALNAPNRWWDSVALLDRAFAAARPSPTPVR
jgi:serine-type D-Ala-D-Ala carboxypeptidase (penicillin-binding protein 5/6)